MSKGFGDIGSGLGKLPPPPNNDEDVFGGDPERTTRSTTDRACTCDTYVTPVFESEQSSQWKLRETCDGSLYEECGYDAPYLDADGDEIPQYAFVGITLKEMLAAEARHQEFARKRRDDDEES